MRLFFASVQAKEFNKCIIFFYWNFFLHCYFFIYYRMFIYYLLFLFFLFFCCKFRFFDIISIETAIIGRSSICNERILNRFSSYIENQLIELSKKYNQIHLFLSCSSALCLSIGQKIRVHELCPIYVYDFDKGNKSDSRPWSLKLTE